MKKYLSSLVLFFIYIALTACTTYKKNEVNPVLIDSTAGIININVDANFSGEALVLDKYFSLNSNDSIKVSLFKFYLTNIKFKNSITGAWVIVPNSYFLFDQAHASFSSNLIRIPNMPAGEYSEIAFYTGVDSLANTNEVIANSIPALSPTNEMIWSWSSGYVFYKLNGMYKNVGQMYDKGPFVYDVGSNATLAKHDFVFTKKLVVKAKATSIVDIHADAAKLFTGTSTIDVNTNHDVTAGPATIPLMQNYSNMYSIVVE